MREGGCIAFVIAHPYVDALACFREPIRDLADHGWRVDLYTTLSPWHPVPNFCHEKIRLHPIEFTRRGAVHLVARLIAHRPAYRWIFAVPQWSLYYAGMACRLAAIPMICISDELKAEKECASLREKKWKERERKAHQRCAFTVAFSRERGDFIREENRLPEDHPVLILPNAPPGPPRRLASRYYQDALGIPVEKRILLHAGGRGWKAARDLAEMARDWSGDWVLVYQGRMPNQMSGRAEGSNLCFHHKVFPADLLDYAVSSAHIGLALYDEGNSNNRLMGTASGKISLYMKNTLPVIATKQRCFAWVQKEGCGLCVESLEEIPGAAAAIWRDYPRYTRAVKDFFAASLDFERHFPQVRARLEGRTSLFPPSLM